MAFMRDAALLTALCGLGLLLLLALPALARLALATLRLTLVLALGIPLTLLVLVLGEWGAFTRRPAEPWRVASYILSLSAWREWNESLD